MNDLFLDEIVQPDARVSGGSRSARRTDRSERDRKRRRRRRRNLTALLIIVLVLGGGGYVVVNWGLPLFDGFSLGGSEAATDFAGPGTGSVDVVIPSGATGAAMAVVLRDAGVVASTKAFTDAFAADPEAAGIQPGTYRLLLQMRAADVVTALLNPDNKVQTEVTIPEGFRLAADTRTPHLDHGYPDRAVPGGSRRPGVGRAPRRGRRELRGLVVLHDVHLPAGRHADPDDRRDGRPDGCDARRPRCARGPATGGADQGVARRTGVARPCSEPDDGPCDPEPARSQECCCRSTPRSPTGQARPGPI